MVSTDVCHNSFKMYSWLGEVFCGFLVLILGFFFLGADKDSLFQIKRKYMEWNFLLFQVSSCGPSAVTHATVSKFVLLPVSC